ncbi:MAG TPA: HlyD family secretion protein [Saprospiraceae bacterium]|nr:HlyD family secretion protein [Saprospiraceae bacterium]
MSTTNMKEKVAMETQETKMKTNKKLFIVIGILTVMLIIGVIYFINSANFETTDNAQLDADIISIKSSVPGYIKRIGFKDNEPVKKGDTLFVIEDSDLKTKVAQAEAALENAKANVNSVQNTSAASNQNFNAQVLTSSSVEQAINSAKARLTKAKADFSRIENMYTTKAATLSQYDAAKADLAVAQAQYDGAVSQFKSANAQSQGIHSQGEAIRAQISLSQALVRQRVAELTLAKIQLGNSIILSPSNGIATKRAVEVGQYITVAQPLCSIIDNSHLWITANFKETQLEDIKIGQTVSVKIDAFPKLKIKGLVQSFIGATGAKFSLLPPDNSTGNFVKITQRVPVRIEITDYPKASANLLFPGLSAFVEVKVK